MSTVSIAASDIPESELQKSGLSISNIVATLSLRRELNLTALASDLNESEYDPEHSPFLVYRPFEDRGPTCLIPANGKISFAGAKSRDDLLDGAEALLNEFESLGIDIQQASGKLQLQNIVVQGDLEKELNLEAIIVLLGLEHTEYEPEQFPGVIYKPNEDITALLYRTGKFVIVGSTSYRTALDAAKSLKATLKDGGIEEL
ncbi:hypothetical protein ACFOZ7_11215 [Natribaculum luteum]|uniref:TATA-box-binding protein n=1 Tax=Natribaculum luteum TaxID=1586232 RepID=A0ABD5NZQ2_9EURY|nr:hypothetical protein [Natribaculum luteum]